MTQHTLTARLRRLERDERSVESDLRHANAEGLGDWAKALRAERRLVWDRLEAVEEALRLEGL